jgi:hypothetical protein
MADNCKDRLSVWRSLYIESKAYCCVIELKLLRKANPPKEEIIEYAITKGKSTLKTSLETQESLPLKRPVLT